MTKKLAASTKSEVLRKVPPGDTQRSSVFMVLLSWESLDIFGEVISEKQPVATCSTFAHADLIKDALNAYRGTDNDAQ